MVNSCCAINCTKRNTREYGLTFHRFPSEPTLKRKWILATKRPKWKPTMWSVLCSAHFSSDSYYLSSTTHKILKKDAVSSIFEFPDHLRKKNESRRVFIRGWLNDSEQNTSNIVIGTSSPLSSNTAIDATNPVLVDHTYAITESPRKIKNQLLQQVE
ncbi:THAP domain-containing protein 6-like [Centruroides sculpturatus]|uniref:THAP domain-containing protein 6-like n=1 Tax=Centruroides sculpturatus TaxID=218467 RepID=UPI000C6E85C1|nr:THAP domain-containing protein 6-like [Centruroides sculpturatus]